MRVNGKNLLRKEKKHLKCALFRSGVKSCYLSPSGGWYLPSLPSLAVLNEDKSETSLFEYDLLPCTFIIWGLQWNSPIVWLL